VGKSCAWVAANGINCQAVKLMHVGRCCRDFTAFPVPTAPTASTYTKWLNPAAASKTAIQPAYKLHLGTRIHTHKKCEPLRQKAACTKHAHLALWPKFRQGTHKQQKIDRLSSAGSRLPAPVASGRATSCRAPPITSPRASGKLEHACTNQATPKSCSLLFAGLHFVLSQLLSLVASQRRRRCERST